MLLEKLFGYRASFASHSLRHDKRRTVLQLLVVLNILILVTLNYYFSEIEGVSKLYSRAYSRQVNDLNAIKSRRSELLSLVNSTSNRVLFKDLQYGESSFYNSETDVLGTVDYSPYNRYQRQPYVSNGYIGARIPSLGQGFTYDQLDENESDDSDRLSNGWPLFNERYSGAFVAGFYDIQKNTTETNFADLIPKGYESIISAIPQWTTLTIAVEKNGYNFTLDPSLSPKSQGNITMYSQQLSMATGIVTTEFLWLDTLYVTISVLAHRSIENLGVVDLQLTNIGGDLLKVSVKDEIDFKSSQRCQLGNLGYDDDGIYMLFSPHELEYVTGAVYSKLVGVNEPSKGNSSTSVHQLGTVELQPSNHKQVTKFVGIATSDLNVSYNSSFDVFEEAEKVVKQSGSYQDVLKFHQDAWKETIGLTKITFPGDLMMTMASRASLYHLAANTRPGAVGLTAALPVGGLSSDSYGGMVFWDTDLWMLNGMLPLIPDHARSLIRYRLHLHEQARKNVPSGYGGAVYPWTSGRFGNCTSTGPCLDYEYHINTAVAISAWELYLSGAEGEEFLQDVALPIINDAATFYNDYVVHYNDTMSKYTTHNLTDPDEYANHVDNGAYTNAGISLVMKMASATFNHLGKSVPQEFIDVDGDMFLPSSDNDDNITLEYSGMNSSVEIKQADVIMITYPLGNELISRHQAQKNMQFYARNQVNYGPAMTFPIFSIVSSELSSTGCSSQSYLKRSIQPFLRAPFAQFSEQNNDDYATNGGTHPAFPFMTAHGGFLQAVLQGLVGLRYDYEIVDNKISRYLTVDPIALPNFKDGVVYEGVKYLNNSLDLLITNETMTIKKSESSIQANTSLIVNVAERNAKSGKFDLNEIGELTIPLFFPNQTYEGSLVECGAADVFSVTESVDGDVVELLNDGDLYTNWQAINASETAKILVDLKSEKNIKGGEVNWGDRPPKSWKLSAVETKNITVSLDEFLIQSDFGNDLHGRKYVLNTVIDEDVLISAPYEKTQSNDVQLVKDFNTTTFTVNDTIISRFFLLEVEGIHDLDDSNGGSKINEFNIH